MAIVLLALFGSLASAASASASARAEIQALLDKLASSGCKFNRNGTWHEGAEAKTHLLRKLEYLEDKGAVQNTEQFIELAASKSSSSGTAYLVKCGTTPPIESQIWLVRELGTLRASRN